MHEDFLPIFFLPISFALIYLLPYFSPNDPNPRLKRDDTTKERPFVRVRLGLIDEEKFREKEKKVENGRNERAFGISSQCTKRVKAKKPTKKKGKPPFPSPL